MTGGPHDGYSAFISYRRALPASSAVAGNLHEELERRGVRTYLDVSSNQTGALWRRDVESATDDRSLRVGVVIIEQEWVEMLGHPAPNDDMVLHEVERFLQRLDESDATTGNGPQPPFVVYPIYIIELNDPTGFPNPPTAASSRAQQAYDRLYEIQTLQASAYDHSHDCRGRRRAHP